MVLLGFLILLLVSLVTGELIRIEITQNAIIKPLDMTTLLLVVTWIVTKIKHHSFKRSYLFNPILIFVSIALLSLFVNSAILSTNELLVSFLYLGRWLLYVMLAFVVMDFTKDMKQKTQKLLVASGAVVLTVGYIQYIFYNNLHNLLYLGWDEHMYRMFSTFLDPNFAGAFLVLYFIFICSKLVVEKKKNQIIVYSFIVFFTLGAIFLTYSRSALLMLVAGVFILLLKYKRVQWILGTFAIIAVFFALSSKNFHVENINPFRIVSTQARITSVEEAIGIIKENPIIGVGFNAYRYAQLRLGTRSESGARVSHADAGTDNSILFILATTGIVGLVAYLNIWKKVLDRSSPVVLASVISLFVNSMFINSLFYPAIMVWMWILIGITEKE